MASSDMLGQETEMIGLQEALSALGAGDLALGLRQLVKDSDDAKDAFLEVLSELITSEISEASLSPLPLLDEISDRGLAVCDWDRVLTTYENTCPLLLACLRATLAARQGQTEQRKDQGKVEAVKSAVGVILSLIFYMAAPESFQIKSHIDTLVSWLPQWEKQMKGGRITRSGKASSPCSSKTPEQSPTKRRRTPRHNSPAAQTFSPKTTTIVSSQSDETFGSSLIENMEMSVTDDDNLEETPEPSLTLLTTLKHDAESGNDLVSFSVKQEPSADQSESMIEEFVGDLSDDHHEDLDDKTEGNFPDGETPDGNGPDPDGELVEFEESSSQLSKGKGKKRGKKANRMMVGTAKRLEGKPTYLKTKTSAMFTEASFVDTLPEEVKPKYRCTKCLFSTDALEELDDHEEANHLKISSCIFCSESFPSRRDLNQHMRSTHKSVELEEGVKYMCTQCSYTSNKSSNLKRHCQAMHGGTQFACDKCPKTYGDSSALHQHIQVQHEQKRNLCDYCGSTFKSKSGLQDHKRRVHQNEFKFQCATCGKQFTHLISFQGHMNAHEGKREVCGKCGAKYIYKTSLIRHEKKCGKDTLPYSCHICSRQYTTRAELAGHMADRHLGHQFECNKCGKTFNYRSSLAHHRKKCGGDMNMSMYDVIFEPGQEGLAGQPVPEDQAAMDLSKTRMDP